MAAQTTRVSLLHHLRDHNDAEAWTTFCDTYGPLVFGYCKSRGLDGNDAADVAQEVLLRVTKAIKGFQYDRSRGRFRDWLSRIVHNEIARWYSRRRQMAPLAELPEQAIEEDLAGWNQQFHQHILNVALARIQGRFKEDTWTAFERVWLKDEPVTDVASSMNRPLEFVYVSKSRVLKRLRLEIEQLAEDACV